MVSFTTIFTVAGAILPTILAAPTPAPNPELNLPFGGVTIRNPSAQGIIENHYIVVFKNGTSASAINNHKRSIQKRHLEEAHPSLNGLNHEYDHPDFMGYSGSFSKRTLQEIAKSDEVDYIEADTKFTGQGSKDTTQASAPWGLDRISNKNPRSSPSTYWKNTANTFSYDTSTAGTGVTIYLLDSGILTTHTDFGGRASWGYNAVAGSPNADENGHGTHAAGIAVSKTYGVAKNAKIVAVKVLNKVNVGSASNLVAGVNWVRNNAKSGVSVLSISISGSSSDALNTAVTNAINAGITVVVAAGNAGADASTYSPANVPAAITVAASDTSDSKPSFSNFGPCVDIFAPGSLILSTWFASNTATNTMTGTSTATPHIAGLAAFLISQSANRKLAPADVWSKMSGLTNNNMIKTPGTGTPNRLAFNVFT